jgi:prepilin-type N-terminal cleavage/methylation domain-containing protein
MKAMRDGFTLIEVMVAMMILTMGILAMGASTGFVLNQVRASEFRTDRAVAVRQATETLRATPEATLLAGCGSDLNLSDRYTMHYECPQTLIRMIRLRLIVEGPGYESGRITGTTVDTLMINIRR